MVIFWADMVLFLKNIELFWGKYDGMLVFFAKYGDILGKYGGILGICSAIFGKYGAI